MKKFYIIFAFEIFFILNANCGTVDTITAKKVATNFFITRASQSSQQRVRSLATKQIELELVHQELDEPLNINYQAKVEPYYYVYNVKGNNGFIIVSADDAVTPILGYTFNGKYDDINQPPAFIEWMNNYKKQIKYIKTNKPNIIKKVKSEWSNIIPSGTAHTDSTLTEISPLLTSTWGQECYYNTFCPQDINGMCGHVPVGFVAVAMGQILNYWKYPAECNDIPGYVDGINYIYETPISNSAYGWIAGIGSTTYNWFDMANNLTSTSSDLQKNAVAQLLYHCGVSYKMNYGLNGFLSVGYFAKIALIKYFKYSASTQNIYKEDYSITEWKALLTNELDHNRPLFYCGDSIGSHAFVCDGYQNSDYFHFNWGWNGTYNGYFYIENLNPAYYNLNNDQEAIIGISPVSLPIIQYTNYNVTDDETSGIGNGNGIVESGETISFPITLKNSGYTVANNVTAVLSCADTDISIITSTQSWNTIAVDVSAIASNLKFNVSSDCPDKIVEFTLRINSNEGYWTKIIKVHVYKKSSLNVSVAGSLNSLLTTDQKSTVTFLVVTGTIDARDFKALRENFPSLSAIDLLEADIVEYTGQEGTLGNSDSYSYPANTIPHSAFYYKSKGMKTLTTIKIPASVTSIGASAFYNCTDLTSITIPESVTSIGTSAFYNCTGLTSIEIPASVTSIERSAFYNCGLINVDSLNLNYSSQEGVLYNKTKTLLIQYPIFKNGSFIIPSTVTSIGRFAFNSCENLTSVTIPSSVTSIGNEAFSNCTSLTSFIIPESVTSIGGYVFSNCTGLTSIEIPASVTSIERSAFSNCTGLTSITIPSSVTSIADWAFNGITGLINVDTLNLNYSSQDGVLYNKTKTLLIKCPTFITDSFTIPSTVTSIGEYAFYDCNGFTSITIPASVTSIGNFAFYKCDVLTTITLPGFVNSIGGYAFSRCSGLTSIYSYSVTPIDFTSSPGVFMYINKNSCALYVPYGTKSLYTSANQWSDFHNIVENTQGFLMSANTVKFTAANGSNSTISITGNVSWNASSDQTWLSVSPTEGNGNTEITITALANQTNMIRTAIITVSSTSVASQIITVTQSAPTISVTAGGLSTMLSPTELNQISNFALSGNIDARDFKTMRDKMPLLTNLDLSGVRIVAYTGTEGTQGDSNYSYAANSIPNYAFYTSSGNTVLKSVIMPLSLTSIEERAFYYCFRLNNVIISNLVTSIGSGAFGYCVGLTSIEIPASVTSIGSGAFGFCSGLTSIEIPASVTSIGSSAFFNCTGLTSIAIPASVTSIGFSAFIYCTGLTSIYAYSAIPVDLTLSSDVFSFVNKSTCTLYVPTGSKALYQAANQWKDFTNILGFTTALPTLSDGGSIQTYPNPVSYSFRIKGIEGLASFKLFDINGRMILTDQVHCNSIMSVAHLPKGLYVVSITTMNGTINRIIIKK